MSKHRYKKPEIIENIQIIDAGSEGMSIAKPDDKVVFIPFGAPGDVVDIQMVQRRKRFFEGKILKFHKYSEARTKPSCSHFGVCGGCKWQHLAYAYQLQYKQKQVKDIFDRIGQFSYPELLPIISSELQYHYRNKLEFTFSPRKWLTDGRPSESLDEADLKGLGFHLPGMFDRILDIDKCYLQDDFHNQIRIFIRDYAIQNNYSFYNVKTHEGLLRGLILRNTLNAEWMLIVVIANDDQDVREKMIPEIIRNFPQITSLFLVINSKLNDQISDLPAELIHGLPYITEYMSSPIAGNEELQFRIGPVSFFQTNSLQAEKLYRTAFEMAAFKGDETVYDLYTGTGTIANYIAKSVKKVIGIEYVEEAVADARINSKLNELTNTEFIAGDMAKVFDKSFVKAYGKPDVIITDPPRAGMHPKVVERILEIAPRKIVYVSCNPATQARDIALMVEKYNVVKVQPVDMFPQTHHVENVALLELKE